MRTAPASGAAGTAAAVDTTGRTVSSNVTTQRLVGVAAGEFRRLDWTGAPAGAVTGPRVTGSSGPLADTSTGG